jgi:DNA-binding response OmpR family regulator
MNTLKDEPELDLRPTPISKKTEKRLKGHTTKEKREEFLDACVKMLKESKVEKDIQITLTREEFDIIHYLVIMDRVLFKREETKEASGTVLCKLNQARRDNQYWWGEGKIDID